MRCAREQVSFPPIPAFSPELFAYLRLEDPGARKAFTKGVDQLLSEGAVQVLSGRNELSTQAPILAAVGELQFDVVLDRLMSEYKVRGVTQCARRALGACCVARMVG